MFEKFTRTESIQGSLIFIKDDKLFMIIDTFDPELNETKILIAEEAEIAIDDWGLSIKEIQEDCDRIEDIESSNNIEVYFIQA